MFTQDSRTESFLTQMGVKYRYTNDLHLTSLPCGWDVANNARPVPRREDAIVDYAALMESGSAAPAVIVHYANDSIQVLDGVQRLAAALLAGFTRFSAYVVDCDSDDTLAAINALANVRLQGHAEKPEWTKRNAVQRLVIERGMSAAEVAQLGGWKRSEVEQLACVLDWGFHIRCVGGPDHLPDGIIRRISDVASKDAMRAAHKPVAAFLISLRDSRLSTDEALPHVDEFFAPITKQRTMADAYSERLESFLSNPEVEIRLHGRRTYSISGDVNLRRAMKSCISILDGILESGEEIRYVDEFFKLSKHIESRLRKLAPHCPQPDSPRVPADKWQKI